MYTVLIKDGEVFDGTGREAFRADIALQGDRIAAIGPEIMEPAELVIDAGGLAVAPGFIDIHTHTDATIFSCPLSTSKLLQGVTSEVIGNCGVGAFPVNPKYKGELLEYLKIHGFSFPSQGITWKDLAGYTAALAELALGPNLLPLVAHGALRGAVVGFGNQKPTATMQARMEQLLAAALEQGAWGLSAGLIYPPGSFADTEELIGLARVVKDYDGIFSLHIRGESQSLRQSLEEAIRIAGESGARVQVSHLKAMGRPQWGMGRECLARLQQARAAGIDIGADQYPYAASSTSLTALVPQWAHSGGVGQLLQRLADPELVGRIKEEIAREISLRGGPERIKITGVASWPTADMVVGKTLDQIAAAWKLSPAAAVVRLLQEEKGVVNAVYFSMEEEDVKTILASENVGVGSDGSGMAREKGKTTHPRSFGTFPRVIGPCVREGVLTLALAVYKMTGLNARRLGLKDRGLLRPGFAADLTLFDPATVCDRADFSDPQQYPAGIEYVLVNGRLAVCRGALTGVAAGRVLLKKP
ncbi:MAG TPA: D-aminoacylase [Firmicutes bacterium]|nr:D-aminoacylase [Bacillota bacterium]